MKSFPRHLKIGLALGSGGTRGWAHVGALTCLERHQLPIHCVTGTSAGALFGAAFAAEKLDFAKDLAQTMDWRQLVDLFVELSLSRSGLLTGRHLQPLLDELSGNLTFDKLKLPFAAVAADITSEQEVILDSGPVGQAIRASIAIPGIFTPVAHNDHLLVDGGLINPLPVSVARAMGADFVIAIDVNLRDGESPTPVDEEEGTEAAASDAPEHPHTAAAANEGDRLTALRQKLEEWAAKLPPLRHASRAALARWLKDDKKTASIFEVLTQSLRLIENQITRSRLALEPPDLLVQPAVGHILTLDLHRAREAVAAGEEAMERALRDLFRSR